MFVHEDHIKPIRILNFGKVDFLRKTHLKKYLEAVTKEQFLALCKSEDKYLYLDLALPYGTECKDNTNRLVCIDVVDPDYIEDMGDVCCYTPTKVKRDASNTGE